MGFARSKIKDWGTYNRSLIHRGSLDVWISDDALSSWENQKYTGLRGRPQVFSNAAIELCLTLRLLWKLPLRSTQGLISSLLRLLKADLPVPHYSTLSRRSSGLPVKLGVKKLSKARHLVLDSTGLKVYGEGEWFIRQHGKNKRRTWRKLHLGIDAQSQEVVSLVLTPQNVHDAMVTSRLMPKGECAAVYADKAYDNIHGYGPICSKGACPVIPPRSGAALQKGKDPATRARNKNVKQKWRLGDKGWKKKYHYHRRSLAETAMYRQKQLLGPKLLSKKFENQLAEAMLRGKILNKMTHLGMPIRSLRA
jgi:Transposase DDE domain